MRAAVDRRGGPGPDRRGDLFDPGLHLVPSEPSGQLPRQPLDLGPAEDAVLVSGQEGPVEAGRDEAAPGVERGGVGSGGRLGNPEGEAAGVGLGRVGAARLEVGGEGGEERLRVSTLDDGASAAGGDVSEPMGWAAARGVE